MKESLLKLLADHGQQVLTWLLAALAAMGARLLAHLTHSKAAQDAARALALHARDAVQATFQTYVEALKEASADGKLTPEEAAQARSKAIAALKARLSWRQLLTLGGGLLRAVLPGWGAKLDGLLGGAVEAAVADEKKAGKALGLKTSGAATRP